MEHTKKKLFIQQFFSINRKWTDVTLVVKTCILSWTSPVNYSTMKPASFTSLLLVPINTLNAPGS